MEVILLEKMSGLGSLGQRVKVKPGYGRNYLIPQGKAAPATAENIARFEARRAELEKAAAGVLDAARKRAESFAGLRITIARKTGDEGKLFGSVGTTDIAEAATAAGNPLDRHEVRLPEGAFRSTGEYEVELHLHADIDATITVEVVAEA